MNVKANALIPLLIIIVGLMLIIGAILSYLYIQNMSSESSLAEKFVLNIYYSNVEGFFSKGIKVGSFANSITSVLTRGELWYSPTIFQVYIPN